jgi:hypothetical protein
VISSNEEGSAMNRRNLLAAVTAGLAAGVLALVALPRDAFGDTTVIQDTQQGTGVGQVQFSANWNLCTTTCSKAPDNSYRWTSTAGSAATVRFTGHQIKLFGVKEPWSNIATVSIDGGATVDVDFYANPATATVVQVYQSPLLTEATHTLVLTMTSRRNPASGGGNAVTFDRAEILSGGTPSPTLPPTTPPPPGFWLSGGSRNTNLQSSLVEWGNFRGRTANLATVYTTRDAGWGSFVSSHATAGQPAAYTDKSVTLLIQTPPFPSNVSATYSALVAGSYDTYWQQIGTLLKNRQDQGYAPAIVSIGWEFNGSYMYWGGCSGVSTHYSSPAQYIAGYRRIVQRLRVTYPAVQTAWTINAHSTPACTGSTDAAAFYPGDDVVTYIGTDDYDHYPPAPTKADFDARANANAGLYWIGNLARGHGKQLLVPEWGVAPGSGANGTGDNANYIQWMYDTFAGWWHENPKLMKGEFYFADPCGGGNVDSDLIACNPNSRARYQQLW